MSDSILDLFKLGAIDLTQEQVGELVERRDVAGNPRHAPHVSSPRIERAQVGLPRLCHRGPKAQNH